MVRRPQERREAMKQPKPSQITRMAMTKENKERLLKEGKITPERAEQIRTLDEVEQPKPAEVQPPEATGPSAKVIDEWNRAFTLSKGLWDLLDVTSGSDDGITPEGCRLLAEAALLLVHEMKAVNTFFNPEEKE